MNIYLKICDNLMNKKIKFIVFGNTLCEDEPRKCSKEIVKRVSDLIDSTGDEIKAVIIPGDLTYNGFDGSKIIGYEYGGDQDQLSTLHNKIIKVLEHKVRIYLCAGDHDYHVKWPKCRKPIFDYIKARHKGLRYEFNINKIKGEEKKIVLKFVCLHIYPNKKSREFLKKILLEHPTYAYILVFHYTPIGNNIRTKDKKKLLKIISGYNIVAIICGHTHVSKSLTWMNEDTREDYLIILASGDKFALCEYNPEENIITIEY